MPSKNETDPADGARLDRAVFSREERELSPVLTTFFLGGIFTILALSSFYAAAPVLVPISASILLALLLSPIARMLEMLKIPRPLAALLTMLMTVTVIGYGSLALAAPSRDWIESIPQRLAKIDEKLKGYRLTLDKIGQATERLDQPAEDKVRPGSTIQNVRVVRPGVSATLFSGTAQVVTSLAVVGLLTLLLLSSGDSFLRKLVAVIPTLKDKKRAVDIIRSIETDISFYLLAVTAANIVIGIATATAAHLYSAPNPILWGSLAFVLSFAPFIGPAVMSGVLAFVGLAEFSTLTEALTLPLVFLAITVVTNQVIMPLVLGHRLSLNPVAIFLAIVFWAWMWGPIGALLAVPMLACLRIVAERFERLHPLAEFLGP